MRQQKQVQQMDRPAPLAVFLDIDGVLHPASASDVIDFAPLRKARECRIALVTGAQHPDRYGMLLDETQEELVRVLQAYPHVVLVISSAWRNWVGHDDTKGGPDDPVWEQRYVESLCWLKSLLHPEIARRVVGKTSVMNATMPGWDGSAPVRHSEIRHFMQTRGCALGLCNHWVAVDDQEGHFSGSEVEGVGKLTCGPDASGIDTCEVIVLVDGDQGFTRASAEALEAAIQHASHRAHEVANAPS